MHNCRQLPIDGIYASPQLIPAITGGYLAFEAGIPSNHRALWIDVPREVLSFANSNTLCKPSAWWLQCKDPWVIKTYLTNLTYLTQENVFNRVDQLIPAMAQGQLTWAQQQEYELIDWVATSACIQAEWQCHKFKMGVAPWTPDLTKAINQVLYRGDMILYTTRHRVGTSVLRTHAKKWNASSPNDLTTSDQNNAHQV